MQSLKNGSNSMNVTNISNNDGNRNRKGNIELYQ